MKSKKGKIKRKKKGILTDAAFKSKIKRLMEEIKRIKKPLGDPRIKLMPYYPKPGVKKTHPKPKPNIRRKLTPEEIKKSKQYVKSKGNK